MFFLAWVGLAKITSSFVPSLPQWRRQGKWEVERKSKKGNHYWKESRHRGHLKWKKTKGARSRSKESLGQIIKIGRDELSGNLITQSQRPSVKEIFSMHFFPLMQLKEMALLYVALQSMCLVIFWVILLDIIRLYWKHKQETRSVYVSDEDCHERFAQFHWTTCLL